MTYGNFKALVKGLLVGDNVLPSDPDSVKGLLAYGFNRIANEAEALHLLTLNKNKDILRTATGDFLLRNPRLPETDDEELDIDEELSFPLAEFVAGMVSKDKKAVHDDSASKLIMHYNGKVESVLSAIRKDEKTGGLYNE